MSIDYINLDIYQDLDEYIPGYGPGGRDANGELVPHAIMDTAQYYTNWDIGNEAVLAYGKFKINDRQLYSWLHFLYDPDPDKAKVYISILELRPDKKFEQVFGETVPFLSLERKAPLKDIFLSSIKNGLEYEQYLKSWCFKNISPYVFDQLAIEHDENLIDLDMQGSDDIPDSFWLYVAKECGDVSLLKYEDFLKTKHPSPEKKEMNEIKNFVETSRELKYKEKQQSFSR